MLQAQTSAPSPHPSRKTSSSATPDAADKETGKATAAEGQKISSALFSKRTRAIIWGLQTRAVQVSVGRAGYFRYFFQFCNNEKDFLHFL